ncbi:MAG: hypothetical protein LBP59_05495 [Planctomycetaceae bacterium]|jgi:hypothetical protein|nr:hypothetical protein [Planctomycetaceae bacterium]
MMIEFGICCVIFYAIAFLFELSRFFLRWSLRNIFVLIGVIIGFVAHTIFLYYNHHITTQDYINGAKIYFLMTSWILVLIYFYLSCYHRQIPFGLFFLPIASLLIIGGVITTHISTAEQINSGGAASDIAAAVLNDHKSPLLKMLHAITFLLATLSICIGFVAGLFYLVQDWRLRHKRPVGILTLPSIEWSSSICRKTLGASTFILAATIYFGWLLLPQPKTQNIIALFDPLVAGTILMFIFLILFSGILPLHIFKTEGKQVAILTLITFAFLTLTLSCGILTKNSHWKKNIQNIKIEKIQN